VAITQELGRLHELLALAERGENPPTTAQLDMAFRLLLGRLQRHASEEDKLFAALTAKPVAT
jgi:hypothetical protein